MAAAGFVILTPHLRKPTRAEIDAALPASLKAVDPVDAAAQARYGCLMAVLGRPKPDGLPGTAIPDVEAILDQGPLQAPAPKSGVAIGGIDPKTAFVELLDRDGKEAVERGQARRSARDAILGLRFGAALFEGSGSVLDAIVAGFIDRRVVLNAYALDTAGALDKAGRAALLFALPPEDGRAPALEGALRREFQGYGIPTLLDPEDFMRGHVITVRGKDPVKGEVAGSYDPAGTARLLGRIDEGAITNARRRYALRDRTPVDLVERAERGLARLETVALTNGWSRVVARTGYRLAMNWTSNSVGRTMISDVPIRGVERVGADRAAYRNLLRAVVLLRQGGSPKPPYPYRKGDLRIDPKRRIVWSIGPNGKDDGGKIGGGGTQESPDLGFGY